MVGKGHLTRLLCRDIAHERFAALDGSDGVQVDTNDQTAHWHVLHSYLQPSSCSIEESCKTGVHSMTPTHLIVGQIHSSKTVHRMLGCDTTNVKRKTVESVGILGECSDRLPAYQELHTSQAASCCSRGSGTSGSAESA